MARQLNAYLFANDLLPRYQSAYRKRHSTETAMQRVWSDILTAADRRQVTLLGLLDLSAAFDCVDHDIPVQRRQFAVVMSDVVLGWIQTSVIFDQQNAKKLIQRSAIQQTVASVRCSARRKVLYWSRCCTQCRIKVGAIDAAALGPFVFMTQLSWGHQVH